MRTTRTRTTLFLLATLLLASGATPLEAALGKEDLLRLVESGVDSELILGLVRKDCVDFEVDADAILELSPHLPKDVLSAAIECRGAADSMRSAATPPGTAPDVDEISLTEEPPLQLAQIRKVAIIPVAVDGQADTGFTGALIQILRKRQSRYELIDPITLQVHFEDTGAFHSSAPVKSLLAAARATGADAILVSQGSLFRGGLLGIDAAARLDSSLLEVNQGAVIWTLGVQTTGTGWQDAKNDTVKKFSKKIPQ